MRSEAEMMELILETARTDERIRAVVMNGSRCLFRGAFESQTVGQAEVEVHPERNDSRVNPTTKSDIFSDFDIVYVVSELESFKANPRWIDRFGERIVMQLPDDFGDHPPQDRYAYLLQFIDRNRLDLTLLAVEKKEELLGDSLSRVLLDKDGLLELPPPSESSYLPKPPTAKQFFECCNEFWWVVPYVAKGLGRGDVVYAQHHQEILRNQTLKMLEWRFGIATNFQENPGKLGKHIATRMPERWSKFLQTYAEADVDKLWISLFGLTELFREVALEVAAHFGYEYPKLDDARVAAHLRHIQALPQDVP